MQTSVIFETLSRSLLLLFLSFVTVWWFPCKPTAWLSLFRGLSLKGLGSGKKGLTISWNYDVFKLVCAQLRVMSICFAFWKRAGNKLLLQHLETQMTPFLKNVQHSRCLQMITLRDHNRTGLDLRSRPFDFWAGANNMGRLGLHKNFFFFQTSGDWIFFPGIQSHCM